MCTISIMLLADKLTQRTAEDQTMLSPRGTAVPERDVGDAT